MVGEENKKYEVEGVIKDGSIISASLLEYLVVREIFSQVPALPGWILAFVYLWYTNTEQNERKDKINTFMHTKTFNLLYS